MVGNSDMVAYLGIYTNLSWQAPQARMAVRKGIVYRLDCSLCLTVSVKMPHVRRLPSLALLPNLLCECTCPVFCIFSYLPPVRGVYCTDRLLQTPVPPVLGHFHQPNWDYSGRGFRLGLFGFIEFAEDQALLP
jgi:hypothetical protein